MDPDTDPTIFVTDFQDVNKKRIKKKMSAYYFLKVHLHYFPKIKSQKESQIVGIKVFLLFMLDDRRIRKAQKHVGPGYSLRPQFPSTEDCHCDEGSPSVRSVNFS